MAVAKALPLEEPTDFATSDVALVAWLRYNGVEPECVEWRGAGKVCYWLFNSGTKLEFHVDAFQAGNARPEIREFNRIFGATKQEMFNSRPAH